MLKQLDVTNRRGMVLSLEMFENGSGFQVSDIEGLDPVRATLVSTSFAGVDGAQFQSARRDARNIKIKLDLQPDFVTNTYSTLRRTLYSYFMTKAQVSLRFYLSTGLYLDIEGVVEEVPSPRFEQDPKVEVSLMCFKPDFLDPRMVTVTGNTVADNTLTTIDYPGNVETGMVLTLNVNRPLSAFTIYNTSEEDILSQLDFSGSLIAGDQLVVSSLKNAKGITLTRAGVSSSYLYGKSTQSGWIEFSEGINQFRVYTLGDPVPYELEYIVRYGSL
jgi:hypothetical protein